MKWRKPGVGEANGPALGMGFDSILGIHYTWYQWAAPPSLSAGSQSLLAMNLGPGSGDHSMRTGSP